jgi:3-oxoacyl-[acyl-carrier-protein] synthase III
LLNSRRNAAIIGLGSHVPERVLTNRDLEKMVDTNDEWIVSRTGIRERRIIEKGTTASQLALPAVREAIENAKISPEEIDLILVATTTPDMFFPSTAALIQNAIGAKRAGGYDISAACAGFTYGLVTGAQFIQAGIYKHILVVGTEILSNMLDWSDRNTCILFGDGAGAAVLGPIEEGKGILSTYMGSDGAYASQLEIPGGGSRHPMSQNMLDQKLHYLKMSGNEVFKMAVRIMADCTTQVTQRAGIDISDLDYLVPHQANIRILHAAADRLKFDREKIAINLDRYGNMSAASTAVALHEAVRDGKIRSGHQVAIVSFGAGLCWAACAVKWQ